MTQSTAKSNYEVLWLVRRLFRSLADTADRYLREDELTAANRAVMEFLYPDERLSVPRIASKYQTSRQHVQVTANELIAKGLIRAEANPQHKRSPLLRLSALGQQTFAEIRRNETELVGQLFADLNEEDIETTRHLLQSLLQRCESGDLL